MKSAKHTFMLFCLVFLASACEKDVDFKGKEPEPKIVVNSIVNCTGSEHSFKISESVFLFGKDKPQPVTDATLRLQINGKDVPLIFREEKDSHRYYAFTTELEAGDKLEISGESPKHGQIYGIDHVPNPAEIKEVKTEWFNGQKDGKSYLRTLITLKDKPGERNYYRIVIRNKVVYKQEGQSEEPSWVQQEVFVDQEILFNNIGGVAGEDENAHKYRIFSDELIEGQEYTLNVYIPMEQTDPWGMLSERYVKVEIHTLSENLFKYLRSLELAMSEDNFSEPVKIYSNIKNGYGVLGTYNVVTQIVQLNK